jgi:hypothetical protein
VQEADLLTPKAHDYHLDATIHEPFDMGKIPGARSRFTSEY